jgi:hypothetical protein
LPPLRVESGNVGSPGIAFLTGGGVVLLLVLLNLSAELLVTLTFLLTQDSGLVRFVLLVNRGAGEDANAARIASKIFV